MLVEFVLARCSLIGGIFSPFSKRHRERSRVEVAALIKVCFSFQSSTTIGSRNTGTD
jgi:hypothetical protein